MTWTNRVSQTGLPIVYLLMFLLAIAEIAVLGASLSLCCASSRLHETLFVGPHPPVTTGVLIDKARANGSFETNIRDVVGYAMTTAFWTCVSAAYFGFSCLIPDGFNARTRPTGFRKNGLLHLFFLILFCIAWLPVCIELHVSIHTYPSGEDYPHGALVLACEWMAWVVVVLMGSVGVPLVVIDSSVWRKTRSSSSD